MNKLIGLALVAAIAVTAGCVGTPELMKAGGTRNDVFRELKNGGPIPQGDADLSVAFSLKTHKPGVYGLKEKIHGTPEYKLLVNIDGQVTMVTGRLQEEKIEPRGLPDPEAGEGIRYLFRKGLRLRAGTHRIAVAIPEDGVIADREITLKEGKVNELVLEPVYGATERRRLPATYAETSFLEGIREIRVILNGKPIE